jgi:hypothetical protein
MFGRVKDAVADAAETLRRAFAGLKVVEVAPEPFPLRSQASACLEARPRAGLQPPVAGGREMPLLEHGLQARALDPFRTTLQQEAGWASWDAGARVVRMTRLEAGRATRIGVPALPHRPQLLGGPEPVAAPASRRLSDPITRPGVRRMDPGLGPVAAEPGLAVMLSRAVPIQGEDIRRLPKGLWMRYSLQLVRGTGENVRNLEVLGLFHIPRKGVADLRHDPRQGRLLLQLEAPAVRAPRAPFILARRKDDGALVSCYLEDA